jgi:hypothetical protein
MTYIKPQGVELGFNTSTPLGIGASFLSPIIDITTFKQVQTNVLADADGTIEIFFFNGAGGTDPVRVLNIPYVAAKGYQLFSAPKFGSHVQYGFLNGGVAQTDFYYETWLFNDALSAQVLAAEAFISPSMTSSLTRTINVGKTPDGVYQNVPETGYVSAGTSTTPLGIAGVFDSGIIEINGFTQLATELLSDQDGTLVGSWYSDAAGTNLVRTFTRPFTATDGYAYFSSPVFAPYFKYVYTNGAVGQTDFYIGTKLLTQPISGQILGLKDFIPSNVAVNMGRSIIVGEDTNGAFRNIFSDTEGNLQVRIANPVTAFGDLRNAELTPQVALTFEYNLNVDMINVSTLTSGVATQSDAKLNLDTGTAVDGYAAISSIGVLKYRAGLGALARFTGLFTPGIVDAQQIIGVGNQENGFFFGVEKTLGGFGILNRNTGSDTWIFQENWNHDTMTGTGPSGMILDISKLNVFEISFQYLGAGQISFYIEDENTGFFTLVHQIDYANNSTNTSLSNPSLPLLAEVQNIGNTSRVTLESGSMAGFVEGKNVVTGPSFSFSNTKTHSVETPLLSIRSKTVYQGVTNTVNSIMRLLSVANDVNFLATFRIYEDTTLGGVPAWKDISLPTSVMESDIDATSVTGGRLKSVFSVGKDSGNSFNLKDLNIIMKPGSIYTITSESGASGEMGASLTWVEDF